jgi:hypothetical protein
VHLEVQALAPAGTCAKFSDKATRRARLPSAKTNTAKNFHQANG